MANVFQGPVMALWGCDVSHQEECCNLLQFRFHNASWQFGNMTLLLKYINVHPELGVKIRYATVEEYFDYLYNTKLQFTVKSDTFL